VYCEGGRWWGSLRAPQMNRRCQVDSATFEGLLDALEKAIGDPGAGWKILKRAEEKRFRSA
jgi:hypothetical protein